MSRVEREMIPLHLIPCRLLPYFSSSTSISDPPALHTINMSDTSCNTQGLFKRALAEEGNPATEDNTSSAVVILRHKKILVLL